MNKSEARSGVKALYLQAASLAGLEVTPDSPERLCYFVDEGFDKVEEHRRPEAVANILKLLSASLMAAQENKLSVMGEDTIEAGENNTCPVYPFD